MHNYHAAANYSLCIVHYTLCKVTTFCPNDKVDVKKTIVANTQIWLMHTDFLQKRDDYLLIFRHCVCC